MTTLTNEQKVSITVSPVTASGKPAKIDGQPLWTSSNTQAVTLEVAPDGLSAFAIGVAAGVSTITIAADSDLGAGVVQISNSVDITVTNAPAASLTITVGTPQ